MAGTLSACPRDTSVSTGLGALSDGPTLEAAAGPAFVRLLQGAVLLHCGAVALVLILPHALHSLALLCTAFAVTVLVLSLPQIASRSDRSLPAKSAPAAGPMPLLAEAALAVVQDRLGEAALSPLPFMGDRIILNSDAASITALARAAARVRVMSTVRTHPWGDLIARVSHDLRTPLNAVIGFSDVIETELLGPVGHPRYREYARHIRESGRELLKSAEDTLAITCLLDHDPDAVIETAVDFAALVDDAWAFYADPHDTHGLSLETSIPSGLEVLIDRRCLRQILINLFAEAVRRSDSRGVVGLVASADGDLVQIEVFLRGRPDTQAVGQASLPVCLARALLELQGAALIEVDHPCSTWRALTVVRCAAQSDFFDATPSYAQPAMQLC